MAKFYLQVQPDGIITDAISYPYGNYTEFETDYLPIGICGGWFKLENGQIVEHPELKPSDPEVTELKQQLGLVAPYFNPSTLDEIKVNKIYELSKACEEEILAGFYSNARGTKEWYTNSRDDQSNVIAQASLATLNPSIVPQWKSAAERICTDFTLAQIVQLATDGATFKTERIKALETLKVQVSPLTTEAEVRAITWAQKVWS